MSSSAAFGVGQMKMCATETAAREMLRILGLDEAYFDPKHDRCYCHECFGPGLQDIIANSGPTLNVVPRGWYRCGLALPPRSSVLLIFEQWSVSFHGVKSAAVLQSIMQNGRPMKPVEGGDERQRCGRGRGRGRGQG